MTPLSFMLIAGEPSGDLLAAELVRALHGGLAGQPFPPQFFGAGGPKMAEAGVELAIDLTQHSVIGLSDVLKKYWKFKQIFDHLLRLAHERKPDVIICIDFQAFNRHFIHAVRKYLRARHGPFNNWNPKIIQYVSPQVWASRPGRAYQLTNDVDLLLSIIPFEKAWYAACVPKLRVEFVGHPIVDRYASAGTRCRASDESAAREIGDTQQRVPTILLLPGSRQSELRRHLPVMIEAARLIQEEKPGVRFKMVLPNEDLKRSAGVASALLPGLLVPVGGLAESLPEADLAIASTGTVMLECAMFGVPTVAIYKTSWSTYFIAKQIVTVQHLAMPNLLANETIYPELIQGDATGENIAQAALALLNNERRRKEVKAKLAQVVNSLGEPGASRRAARAVLSLLG